MNVFDAAVEGAIKVRVQRGVALAKYGARKKGACAGKPSGSSVRPTYQCSLVIVSDRPKHTFGRKEVRRIVMTYFSIFVIVMGSTASGI